MDRFVSYLFIYIYILFFHIDGREINGWNLVLRYKQYSICRNTCRNSLILIYIFEIPVLSSRSSVYFTRLTVTGCVYFFLLNWRPFRVFSSSFSSSPAGLCSSSPPLKSRLADLCALSPPQKQSDVVNWSAFSPADQWNQRGPVSHFRQKRVLICCHSKVSRETDRSVLNPNAYRGE